jgi:TolA protein
VKVEREPQLEPPNLLHRDRLDPSLVKAFAFSAVAHVVVIVALIVAGTAAHRALKPATTYSVGLVDLDSGSPLLDVGPLGDQPAPRENVFGAPAAAPPPVAAPPEAVKKVEPAPPKPAPQVEAKVEPPAPKPEATPPPEPPKVEAKAPEPKPVPKAEPPKPKVEAKPAPKPEVKPKPEPKPAPKAAAKPEPKPKAEPAKTAAKPAEKPPVKAEAKPAKAETKPAASSAATKSASAPTAGSPSATGAQAGGGVAVAKATPPGAGSGGGGGFGGSGPGGGPAGGELRSPEFVAYFEHIKRTIRRGWVWQTADQNIRTTVGFAVLPDGRLANIRSVESSGDARFDTSVLNAVRAAQGQLGPPPAQYQRDFSDVQIVFRPQDLAE